MFYIASKKTEATMKHDKSIAEARYRTVVSKRREDKHGY